MDDKLTVFLHIPKTGGTTLGNIIKNRVALEPNQLVHLSHEDIYAKYEHAAEAEKAEVKVVIGHLLFGVHELFPKPPVYFTMLREPVDRVISLYYFLKDYPGYYQDHMKNMSFEEYLDWDPQAKNGQATLISGQFPPTLETTLENLETFAFIGLTEMFNESLYLLNKKFDWSVYNYKKANITKSRPAVHQVPDHILKKIERYNEMDIQIYNKVKADLVQQIQSLSDREREAIGNIKVD